MSIPEPMPCVCGHCWSPTYCVSQGYCREENFIDPAKEYEEALAACRECGITDPFGEPAKVRGPA